MNYYVRIDRDDGSRTYKGPAPIARMTRERDCWREHFPTYTTDLVPSADAQPDVRAWRNATRDMRRLGLASRYYPTATTRH